MALVLSVLLTWPMVAGFGSLGRVHSGDGRYSIWNVAWVAHALTTDPAGVFDANIFDPHENTLAYSEANLVAGAIAAPVWWLTANPYAAMNAATFAGFVLSFLATFALARRVGIGLGGALFSAITFAFCPFVFAHLPHIQLLMTFGLPLVGWAMPGFVEAPSPRTAAGLGLSMAVAALACGYYGIFGGLAAGLGVVWFGVTTGRWRAWRYWAFGLGAAALAGLVVGPFFLPYLDIQSEGFERSLDDARRYSATWRAYLASAGLLHRWMLPWLDTWTEVLFPGFLPIGFAMVALVGAWRTGGVAAVDRAGGTFRRGLLAFYVTLGVLALWASAGPDAGLYLALHETLPFFSLLRAPARFGILVILTLAVLGGVGVDAVARRVAAARRTLVVAAILAAAVADSTVGALPLFEAPPVPRAVRWLAELPRAPVAEFPYFSGQTRSQHTEYMLMSTFHWQPLINGYSDHMPPGAAADMTVLATFPSPDAWDVLEAHGARWVLVHWRLYAAQDQRTLRDELDALSPHLRLMVEEPAVSLYEIVNWP